MNPKTKNALLLFFASFLALYFELILIRYLSTEVRVFSYLKNFPLIASFFGIGLGMVYGAPPKFLKKIFPGIFLIIFGAIANAEALSLTHIPFPRGNYLLMGGFAHGGYPDFVNIARFTFVVTLFLALTILFFIVLGGIIGEYLAREKPLKGYGINLLGSLAGIAVMSALSYASTPPGVWILVGAAALTPFYFHNRLALLTYVLTCAILFFPKPNTFWSPYYQLSFYEFERPKNAVRPGAYGITVNHDYFQKLVDLSPDFIKQYPDVEPNKTAYATYELPYKIAPNPKNVLIIGAGAGNDAAAALRHKAENIDAVEIDHVIYTLGKKYHPEKPYDSPKVKMYIDDARAFLKKTQKKYDLVVFAYLDAHTMLTSLSSIRLDDYVYTKESFLEAKKLLTEDGTLVVSFASGNSFVTPRIYKTLKLAFGTPPLAYATNYDSSGRVFIQGKGRETSRITDFTQINDKLEKLSKNIPITTDNWPFLYLKTKDIPMPILFLLEIFIFAAAVIIFKTVKIKKIMRKENMHFFLLGAGFLLMETKAVTQISLLFGSTWIVNSVVFSAFLAMAFLANALASRKEIPLAVSYSGLFMALLISIAFPYHTLEEYVAMVKIFSASAAVGLPVFFSGLIFSQSFKKTSSPSQALGVNLFGAVVGGALENTILAGGVLFVGILAISIYVVSSLVILIKSRV